MISFRKVLSLFLALILQVGPIASYAATTDETISGKPSVSNRIAGYVYIPAGTGINCELITALDSGKNKEGERVLFKTTENLIVNNLVVIPRGSMGEGIITKAKSAGGFGSGGAVEIQTKHVKGINNIEVPVSFKMNEAGGNQNGWVIPAFLFVSIFAGFIQGDNQKIPAGTPFQVQVSADSDLGGTKEELEQVIASQNTLTVTQIRENAAKKSLEQAAQAAKAIPEIMTVEQLAEYLQIDKASADELIKNGQIKTFQVGNNVRIKKKDVDAYLGGNN